MAGFSALCWFILLASLPFLTADNEETQGDEWTVESLTDLAAAGAQLRLSLRHRTSPNDLLFPEQTLQAQDAPRQRDRKPPRPRHTNSQQSSRGIVIAAGGRDMLANALVTVLVLRGSLGCSHPVEIFYSGEDEADSTLMTMLERIPSVFVLDSAERPYPLHVYKPDPLPGWLKKILAIYHASFDQFLYLDADSLPLINPELMFEWEAFQQHGSVFWPDYMGPGTSESVKEEAYTSFGLQPPWLENPGWRCSESGQFLLDRKRHADVLEWLLFLNAHTEVRDSIMYGDKDTFELAFALAGRPDDFQQIAFWPRATLSELRHDNTYWHVGMMQNTPKGQPAFLHRTSTSGKWTLSQDAKKLLRPSFLTPPLTRHAHKTVKWNEEYKNGCWEPENVLTDDKLECENIDLASLIFIEQQDPERWKDCHSKIAEKKELPIALMPIDWFPQTGRDAIFFAFASFEAIQASVNGGGPA